MTRVSVAKKKDAKPGVELESSSAKLLAGEAVARIRKEHGANIFGRASDFVKPRRSIPTGIFRLDYALGGGFPVGLVSVLWGHKSSGKTTTYLKAIANAQRMCAVCWEFTEACSCGKSYRDPVIAFLDVEGTLDLAWAKRLGVDLDRLLLSTPEYAEQSLDIAEAVLRRGVDVLVMDSLAFLTPAKEIMQSTIEDTVGLQARQIGKGTRKFVAALNTVKNARGFAPTLLFTNQVRMKVGVMFGSPETQPGGLATGFASATETRLRAGKYEMDEVLGKPVAADFGFRVDKNKASFARMEGEFRLAMADTEHRRVGDAVNEGDMVEMAQKVGLVEGSGSSWRALGEKYRAKSLIEKEILTNPEFHDKLHRALTAVLLSDHE